MFRTALLQTTRVLAKRNTPALVASRPIAVHFIRLNSSQVLPGAQPPLTEAQKKKEALKRNDDLQRDWDAVVLSYEALLPKTESPTPNTFLIDVREPDEVVQGMIPSAVNLPLTVLANSLHLQPEQFQKTHGFEKPRKDQEVIFYCRSGMRSTSACDIAKRNGFTNILNYKGSWLEWTEKQSQKS